MVSNNIFKIQLSNRILMYFDWAYYKFIGVNLPVCITMGSITCLGLWLIVLCMYTRSLSTIFHQFIMSSVSNVITSIHSLPLHLFTLFYLSIYAFVYLSVYPLNLELTFIVICSGYIYVFFFTDIIRWPTISIHTTIFQRGKHYTLITPFCCTSVVLVWQ